MAVSTDTDWTLTAAQVCLQAAQELGAIGMGDSLEDTEEEAMVARLNGMLAKWSTEGNLWREATDTITLTGGTGVVTLPTDMRDVRGVRHVQSATYKRWLSPWNRDEYMRLPNRVQVGTPTIYYHAKQQGAGLLYLWPAPATDQDLEVDYSRTFYQITDPSQEVDIPKEWLEAVLYGLAARCANIFGTTRVDPNTVQRIDAQAKAEFDRMLDADRPDAYQFEYDTPVEIN